MNEAIIIYLYVVIGNIIDVAIGLGIAYTFGFGVTALASAMHYEMQHPKRDELPVSAKVKAILSKLRPKIAFAGFVAAMIASALYPSTNELKYIIGGAAAWNTFNYVQNSEEAKKLPDNVLKAMNSFLENVEKEEAK